MTARETCHLLTEHAKQEGEIGAKRIIKEPVRYMDQYVSSSASRKRPIASNLIKAEEPCNNVPDATNIRSFLDSGLLNGYVVTCYKKTPIAGETPKAGTSGKIENKMIVCLCKECECIDPEGWPPSSFEKHAGCLKKRPAENFYFKDGVTVKFIMDMCNGLPLAECREEIHKVLGFICMNCKGLIPYEGTELIKPVCIQCQQTKELSPIYEPPADNTVSREKWPQDTPEVFEEKHEKTSEAGSGSASQRPAEKKRGKKGGREPLDVKNVVKLFKSKAARDEILQLEKGKIEATEKLNTVYDEIRPVIEEHGEYDQESVDVEVAKKWVNPYCYQMRADVALSFGIIKNFLTQSSSASASRDEKTSEDAENKTE